MDQAAASVRLAKTSYTAVSELEPIPKTAPSRHLSWCVLAVWASWGTHDFLQEKIFHQARRNSLPDTRQIRSTAEADGHGACVDRDSTMLSSWRFHCRWCSGFGPMPVLPDRTRPLICNRAYSLYRYLPFSSHSYATPSPSTAASEEGDASSITSRTHCWRHGPSPSSLGMSASPCASALPTASPLRLSTTSVWPPRCETCQGNSPLGRMPTRVSAAGHVQELQDHRGHDDRLAALWAPLPAARVRGDGPLLLWLDGLLSFPVLRRAAPHGHLLASRAPRASRPPFVASPVSRLACLVRSLPPWPSSTQGPSTRR